MNRELLLQHFNRISEAPEAIPRLRRFILDLAVRGKLVEQDPGDEPAAELLKRIQAEKAQLVKEGKIKETKEIVSKVSKTPYALPATWCWVQLGITVNSHLGGGTPSKNNSIYWDGNIFWASVKDIGKGKYVDNTIDRISEAGLKDSSSNLIPPGNLIVVTRMGLGKISINRVPIAINQDLRALSLSSLASIDYYYNFFKTHGFDGSGLTVKGIRVEELLNTPFPLPPLAEQHRIVAKVDELMALCDQLEAERNQREAHRDKLVAASLNRISTTTAEEAKEAARFHLNLLPRLTTKPEHIKQLRQTILNLAVRGKLVEQDPSDEPANITGNDECDALHELPNTWKWTCISAIADLVTDGEHATPVRISEQQIPLVTAKNVRDGEMDYSITDWVSYETAVKAWRRCKPSAGDILLVCVGATTGRLCVLREPRDMVLVRSVAVIRPSGMIDVDYFALAIRSPIGQSQIWSSVKVTAQPCLYINRINALSIPLPPLAEQQRIVAKVNELMTLCDQLEAQLTATTADNRRLLEAVLHDALKEAV